MAILKENTFTPKSLFRNKHFNTVYRTLSTKPYKYKVNYKRERINTPDGDFIDLDISSEQSKQAVIVVHGLEGSAQSLYVLSLVKYLNSQKIDVISVNLRGCGGQDNKFLYAYHAGFIQDLECVIKFIIKNYNYQSISLVGYSLGGNMVLKYMGEKALNVPEIVKCCVAVSAPCNLEDSSKELAKKSNFIYMAAFLKSVKEKARLKFKQFPNHTLDKKNILASKNFFEFDNYFTAPVFGYKSAEDLYQSNSCKPFLQAIKKPTILLTALDDPFLGNKCYPFDEAKNHNHFDLLATKYGGHVGFNSRFKRTENLWSEKFIASYIKEHIGLSQ
jgi:uncharacterized protein